MKFCIICTLCVVSSCLNFGQSKNNFSDFQNTITTAEIRHTVNTLSSPEFGGREAGTPNEKRAAEWIAARMAEAGLKGIAIDAKDPYAQAFRFIRYNLSNEFLVANKDTFLFQRDFYYAPMSNIVEKLDVVSGGHGRESELQNLDVAGKIVALETSVEEEADSSEDIFPSSEEILATLEKKKAKGVMYSYNENWFDYIPFTDMYDEFRILNYLPEENQAQRDTFRYLLVKTSVMNQILGIPGHHPSGTGKMHSRIHVAPAGKYRSSLSMFSSAKIDTMQCENVLGIIPGTTLKDEVIVISAHFDHLGEKEDKYYPGADDNASGVSALLSLAKVFSNAAKIGFKPLRTIVFAAFSAEEDGEFGSSWYASHSLGKTVLNLNMDMIGRTDTSHSDHPNYVYYLTDEKQRVKLTRLLTLASASFAPELKLDGRLNQDDFLDYYHRSDHHSFAVEGIPFIVFTTGEHPDYHQVTDTSDKVDAEKISEIAKVVGAIAWDFAYNMEN